MYLYHRITHTVTRTRMTELQQFFYEKISAPAVVVEGVIKDEGKVKLGAWEYLLKNHEVD